MAGISNSDRAWVKARGTCLKGASQPPASKQQSSEAATKEWPSRDHCPEGPPAVYAPHPPPSQTPLPHPRGPGMVGLLVELN